MIGYLFKFSWSNFRWQLFKNLIAIIILFILSVYVVYFIPQIFSKLFFLFLLFLFLLSKKDYFWFAFFFILAQGPGYFFTDLSGLSHYRLPLYTFFPGMSFTPLDLFVILAFLKAMLKGRRTKLKLQKPLIFILLYMIFSLFITFVYGTDIMTLVNTLRGPFYYSIIISFLYLITKRKEAYYFILLIMPFVFFIIFTQLYFLITGVEFINLFYPGYRGVTLIGITKELRPIMGGVLIEFLSFIFSLFLLANRENTLSKTYLYLIIVFAFFSIFISATRIWFVVFSFVLLGYILISKRKLSNIVKIVSVLCILIIILFVSGVISLNFLVRSAWGRISQLFDIAKGDFHSVHTFDSRYFVRLPRLLKGVKENIIIGCGFSNIYLEYRDNHVGFFNTFLQFGILGFLLFFNFFISYFRIINTTVKNLNNNNPLKTPLKILSISFAGILFSYFTTWNFFDMGTRIITPFFLSVFISLTELFVREADKLHMIYKANNEINLK